MPHCKVMQPKPARVEPGQRWKWTCPQTKAGDSKPVTVDRLLIPATKAEIMTVEVTYREVLKKNPPDDLLLVKFVGQKAVSADKVLLESTEWEYLGYA